ncbi:Sugar phosphate isomerase/epimerase [Kaistia soli DSM 19436]|uniref:Sugar phosphate isomerase/epimerase n=1 Tax=Kaistia soli DSM 19436 TaxID=1122133 RepID=A0A1M5PFQ8_9HYPH|nr:sugar phosphate isomerase/epimerase family protein [Kaistia soli]SHH00644.1 Sugar phosphate isomerase/epimerase [Kaistia soli DSM 19436]
MRIGIEGLKMPEATRRGPLASLDHARSYGMAGISFSSVLDMSPTLDSGALKAIRSRADELGMYLEAGLGKLNPYCSAEAPELRAIGDGDIVAGLRRMMEASAEIGCQELWASLSNFKPQYSGRLANDRFRTDVTWPEQLLASERLLRILAPIARDLGIHINLETHDEVTSFELVRLVENVGPDAIGIVLDTANVLQRGEHPVWAARRVAPYIRQTHIKDAYVAHAPGGLDFQTRPCGNGIVDFRAILPIIAAVNPAMNLTIEPAQSTADKRRAAVPRQRIEIDDPIWLAAHPDLTREERAAYEALIGDYEKRIAAGEVADWETYERTNYGWPTYVNQSYGYAEALVFIRACVEHLTAIAAELALPLDAPPLARAA